MRRDTDSYVVVLKKIRGGSVEIVLSCFLSSIIAYAISVGCAKYYLTKLNEDWKNGLEKNKEDLIAQIKKSKSN